MIGTPGAPHYGVSWSDDAALSPLSLVEGRAPSGDDEIAIDTQAAEQAGVEVGDTHPRGHAAGRRSSPRSSASSATAPPATSLGRR